MKVWVLFSFIFMTILMWSSEFIFRESCKYRETIQLLALVFMFVFIILNTWIGYKTRNALKYKIISLAVNNFSCMIISFIILNTWFFDQPKLTFLYVYAVLSVLGFMIYLPIIIFKHKLSALFFRMGKNL